MAENLGDATKVSDTLVAPFRFLSYFSSLTFNP